MPRRSPSCPRILKGLDAEKGVMSQPIPRNPAHCPSTPRTPKKPPTLRRTSAHAPRLLRLTPTPSRLTPTAPWPTSVPAPQPLTLTLGLPNPKNHPRCSQSSPPIIDSTPWFLRPIPDVAQSSITTDTHPLCQAPPSPTATADVPRSPLVMSHQQDKKGLEQQLKEAQRWSDEAKAAESRQKEVDKQLKEHAWVEKITRTGQNLVLDEAEINKLMLEKLNKQLDFHCEHENWLEYCNLSCKKVPKKSTIGPRAARVLVLKEAVSRYMARIQQTGPQAKEIESIGGVETGLRHEEQLEDDSALYLSDYDDDLA
ncbi:hypothetical protein E4T56_gene7426 [Termitomyces sp. T112]|nr:hypothetical protein E4T56_gene7426 [Termitomyces sp. T112]